MMEWMTELLLQSQINEMEKADGPDRLLLSVYKRELAVLKRLRVEGINLSGTVEDVEARLKGNSIYFMDKKEYEIMCRKAMLYDAIKKIVS